MSGGDTIYLQRPSPREDINVDGVPCVEQIDRLRNALPQQQLYVHSDTRRLVRVDTSTTTPQITQINQDALVEIAARIYDWTRPSKSGPKHVAPPPPVLRAVLADPGDLPRLRRIADVPYLAPTGRVVYQRGYDAETETYLHLDHQIDPIPDRPSDEQLAEAVQLVAHDALAGFAFADGASKANAIAAEMTPAIQTLYPNLLTPIFLVDAQDNNYGKTTLAQTLVAPLVGHSPDVTPMTTTDRTECRRTIYSLLRNNPASIILDNIASQLAGDAIAAIKTAKRIKDRVIRSSTAPAAEDTALWLATGTLITTSRELGIRSVLVQLSAPPTGNRDPITWAIDRRIEIIRAQLIIMRRWIGDGRKLDPSVKHPKYPRWAELVGGVLQTMDVADLLGNQQLLATRDDESAAWIDLVDRWSGLKGGIAQPRRVSEIVYDAAIPGEPAYDIVAEGRDHDARCKILGHALRRRDGVVVGAWRICAGRNAHAKVWEYWLDPVAPATTPPTPTRPTAPSAHNAARKNPATPHKTPQAQVAPTTSETDRPAGLRGFDTHTHASYARAPARDPIPDHLNPAKPRKLVARAIDSWAATADASIAADPDSVLARAVERERRGDRS